MRLQYFNFQLQIKKILDWPVMYHFTYWSILTYLVILSVTIQSSISQDQKEQLSKSAVFLLVFFLFENILRILAWKKKTNKIYLITEFILDILTLVTNQIIDFPLII